MRSGVTRAISLPWNIQTWHDAFYSDRRLAQQRAAAQTIELIARIWCLLRQTS